VSADFHCIIHDPARAERFQRLFGQDWVYVTSPVAFQASNKTGGLKDEPYYLLDQTQYTDEQLLALAQDIAESFELPLEEVTTQILVQGVPILAKDTYMAVHNPQKWF
jgi:hypothetical protein